MISGKFIPVIFKNLSGAGRKHLFPQKKYVSRFPKRNIIIPKVSLLCAVFR